MDGKYDPDMIALSEFRRVRSGEGLPPERALVKRMVHVEQRQKRTREKQHRPRRNPRVGRRMARRAVPSWMPGSKLGKDTAALLVSSVFHATLLLLLALLALPAVVGQDSVLVSSLFMSERDLPDDVGRVAIQPASRPDMDDRRLDDATLTETELFAGLTDPGLQPLTFDPAFQPPIDQVSYDSGIRPADLAKVSSEAATVESAVDSITGRIKGQLENGNVLVVWLLDASLSLVDDRQRVAERLEPFLEDLASRTGKAAEHRLLNTVVSFGKNMRQRVEPTAVVRRIVMAVEKLPIDTSGTENVFAAVAACVKEYATVRGSGRLMIVVWTDETGDDVERLEETIALCRRERVSVSVVGPSAVLGAGTGLHSYQDPKTKIVFQLPVQRGPDSAMIERIGLEYWFPTRPPGAAPGFRRGRTLPSWYGGRHLKGMASGFSPHALTRLVAATGGTYTIFDRPEDRGPFRAEAMRDYAPAYQTVEKYLQAIQLHPLRRAVHAAVQETLGEDLAAPETMFFVKRDRQRPFLFERPYLTAAQFAQKFRTGRRTLERKAIKKARIIERALSHLGMNGDPDRNLEAQFAAEESPRWRAWYDLTRGRLLATSVRLEEYRLALDEFAQTDVLRESTNHAICRPSTQLRSDSVFQSRALEAARLLNRCVADHPDTPWAYLAERELAYGLGISIRQMTLTLVPSTPASQRSLLPRL